MQRPARRRATARLAAASVVALAIGGCTDGSWFSSAEEEVDQPPSQPDTPADVATDPPGARGLDLSWEEECRWLGVDVDDPPAAAPEFVDLHLEMLPDHLEELYRRDRGSDQRLPGAYRIDGRGPLLSLRDPGIRFRGNSARGLPKKSFSLRFLEDLPGLGTDRVNLNAMYTDPSFVREHLAMRLLRAAGVAAPRTAYVDLHLNGNYEGLYVFVQRVDERLLEELGLPVGDITLVRDRTREANEGNISLFSGLDLPLDDRAALRRQLTELFDWRGDPDWDAVAELVSWVYEPGEDAGDVDRVAEVLDIDSVVGWHAMHVLLGDMDAFTDDHWLYQPDPEAPWQLIAWDKDLTFGSQWVPGHGGVANDLFHYEWDVLERATARNELLRRAFEPPEVRDAFDRRLRETIETFDLSYLCAELAATVPVIRESAEREPGDDAFVLHEGNHFSEPGSHELHVASVLDFVQLRTAFLDRWLDPVDGEPYQASVEVTAEDAGRSLLFTDPEGWTIARLDVLDVASPGEVRIEVAASDQPTAIDRTWEVTSDADVRGHLSLYYRNTPQFGDWYASDDDTSEPVGDQHRLAVVEVAGDDHEALPSVANPFANRVTAEVELAGTSSYVLDVGEG